MASTTPPDIASKAEAYIPRFKLTKLLNQDQAGRRISLLGTIDTKPAVLLAERAAFATDHAHLSAFPTSLAKVTTLGANDIYSWFLAHSRSDPQGAVPAPPDYKLNLIYPCTEKHVKKYSAQGARIVTETPAVYARYVRPWVQRQRDKGTLDWVFNIIEGRTEQQDIIYREAGAEGFFLLPDLNWDRKTLSSLHLLGLVERRDIWSVRDLKKADVEWVKHMRDKFVDAAVNLYPGIERDQLKLYVHCESRIAELALPFLFTVLTWARPTNLPPLPHPHRPRLARGRRHPSHRQGIGSRKHHLPAGDHARTTRSRYAGRESDIHLGRVE